MSASGTRRPCPRDEQPSRWLGRDIFLLPRQSSRPSAHGRAPNPKAGTMTARIGWPIVLIVIGLILRYAVADRVSGINLPMIGLIVAAAGAVWLILELIVNRPRSQVTHETTDVRGGTPEQDERVEREVRRDEM